MGEIERKQIGFNSPDPLSLDCAILHSTKHNIREIMNELRKLKKLDTEPCNIVKYLDIWYS